MKVLEFMWEAIPKVAILFAVLWTYFNISPFFAVVLVLVPVFQYAIVKMFPDLFPKEESGDYE